MWLYPKLECRREGCRGFTVVELTVALVVMAICLLGVGSLLQETIASERVAVLKNQNRAAASAVARELASAIEFSTFGPDGPNSIECGLTRDQVHVLSCYVQSDLTGQSNVDRRRYSWQTPRVDNNKGISLQLQRQKLAGSHSIDPIISGEDQEEVWATLPIIEIGRGISALSVQFQKKSESAGIWSDTWSGLPAETEAKISVTVQGESVEQIVIPHIESGLLEKQ